MNNIIKSIVSAVDEKKYDTMEIVESVLKSAAEKDLAGIPVVGSFSAALNIRKKFLEERFKRNIKYYFDSIKDASKLELNQCIPEEKEEEFHTIGLSILIESEQPIKSELFGNLHYALSKRMIVYTEFHTLTSIIYHNSVPVLESIIRFDIDRWINTKGGKKEKDNIASLATRDMELSILAISSGLATINDKDTVLSLNGILLYYFGFKKDYPWLYWLGFNPRNLEYIRFGDYKSKPKPNW